ncbi:hypothetical protein SELMODRAFT_110449 [Selaginella moellendorffii]|uniref:Stomatal closure-related actin-binding protein PH domain-containing protein n=1 Tax=Selaginella moellendorffii TaxID=88036 RepID=D8S730_SELML|nr:hypothetical protein SELMODRAFT_110449 [Selaginella moellendorffii]
MPLGVEADIKLVPSVFLALGSDEEDQPSPSKREILAKEAADLVAQQKRLSVRDLASKFERGQEAAHAAAAKLAEDSALMLERQELITKLRHVLDALGGRVAGRNRDDVEESVTLVEALGIQLVQREIEMSQEKIELRKMATLFKQASGEAKRMVEEARSVAQAEIEKAKASVLRVEALITEQQRRSYSDSERAELEAMRREVQEARRIKMLHEPSKVMDMDYKLQAIQQQFDVKSAEVLQLRKELDIAKHGANARVYRVDGTECLGSLLSLSPVDEQAPDLSFCKFQWHRISADGGKKELISGAVKSQYAPDPFDAGRILRVDITLPGGAKEFLSTTGPVDPAPGLGNYVEALAKKGGTEFNVVIVQQNGEYVEKQALHALEIGRLRMKLRKGLTTKIKEKYAAGMQLCGARGGGQAAPLAMFWLVKRGLTYMLGFESERERNAAIMLARRFAFDCNVMLAGPDDRSPIGT